MDQVIDKAGDLVLAQGLIGVFTIALAVIAWRLFNLYIEVQEKRINEGLMTAKTIEANTTALETLTVLVRGSKG